MRRAAIVVAEQDGVTRLAFDQRRHIRLSLRSLKDHQITFPFAERLTCLNVVRALMDRPVRRKNKAARRTSASWLPFLAPVWQVARKFFGLTIRAVNVSIDCLVADTQRLTVKLQSTCDLFG